MRERGLVVVIAIALAALATGGLFLYANNVRQDAKTGGELTTVIVSNGDISTGTRLDPLLAQGAFHELSVPLDAKVDGAVTSPEQLKGKITAEPILAGEQIPAARLQGSSSQLPGGALGIPDGYQAFTFPVQQSSAVGGALNRGDHVQVYGSFGPVPVQHGKTTTATSTQTTTVVPDAMVLDLVDSDPSTHSATKVIFVTLALTPVEAQKVALTVSGSQSRVWLGLLPPGQTGEIQKPTTIGQIVSPR